MKDIRALNERAKELQCLYAVDALISDRAQMPAKAFLRVLQEVPAGWQRPESTGACIEYLGRRYVGPGFAPDAPTISEPVALWGVEVGRIFVSTLVPCTGSEQSLFLPEEKELLRRIAGRTGEFLEWKHTELLGERTAVTRNHWAWRQRFAEALADSIDPQRFGVSRMFLGGSTARGDAGSASDIDLYVDFRGSNEQKRDLTMWIEGWSLCLGQVAYQQTGQPFPNGILNVHWLSGEPGIWQRSELQKLTLGGQGSEL